MVEKPRNVAERNRLLLRLETLETEIKEIKLALSVSVDFEKVGLTITKASFYDYNDSADEDNPDILESREMSVAQFLKLLENNSYDMRANVFTDKFFKNGLSTESFAEFVSNDCLSVMFSAYSSVDELKGYYYVDFCDRRIYSPKVRFISDKHKNIIGMAFLVETDTLDAIIEINEGSFFSNLDAITFFKTCYNIIKEKDKFSR